MPKMNKVDKVTDNPFVNLYELEYNQKDKDRKYYVASRRTEEELACVASDDKIKADDVIIAYK
jgi:hypothetical protein